MKNKKLQRIIPNRSFRQSPWDTKIITEQDLIKLAERSGVANASKMSLESFARRMGYQLKAE